MTAMLEERVNNLAAVYREPARVLVVEDDPNDATLIRMALEEQGCCVRIEEDGERAAELFHVHAHEPFDIVFLDLKLPRLSGSNVLRLAHEYMPRTPVVIITGYPESEMVHEASRIGFVELAPKPLTKETIVRIFNTHKISIKNGARS